MVFFIIILANNYRNSGYLFAQGLPWEAMTVKYKNILYNNSNDFSLESKNYNNIKLSTISKIEPWSDYKTYRNFIETSNNYNSAIILNRKYRFSKNQPNYNLPIYAKINNIRKDDFLKLIYSYPKALIYGYGHGILNYLQPASSNHFLIDNYFKIQKYVQTYNHIVYLSLKKHSFDKTYYNNNDLDVYQKINIKIKSISITILICFFVILFSIMSNFYKIFINSKRNDVNFTILYSTILICYYSFITVTFTVAEINRIRFPIDPLLFIVLIYYLNKLFFKLKKK